MSTESESTGTLSRRRLFAIGGSAAAAGAVAATGLSRVLDSGPSPEPPAAPPASTVRVEFHGIHQSGIANPAPGHLLLTAYDAPPDLDRGALAGLFRKWTAAARDLTAGRSTTEDPMIAAGADVSDLTITVGVGRGILSRLGIKAPAALADLPAFEGDELQHADGGGDVIVQICAEDPLVVASTDRVLRRLATPMMTTRWQETGFQGDAGRAEGRNGRNLMVQIDGSNNVSTSPLARSGPVWVDSTEPGWMAGGSYLVVRRIRMLLDPWEQTPIGEQEQVIGRSKSTDAPLGSQRESDPVDLDARGPDGEPLIPAHSHVRLSTPGKGEQMHRRSYSYRSGLLPDGTTDQGLLFLAYVKDPTSSFVPVQRRLAAHDALNAFTLTTASALFAILPGVEGADDWLGRSLLT